MANEKCHDEVGCSWISNWADIAELQATNRGLNVVLYTYHAEHTAVRGKACFGNEMGICEITTLVE